MRYFVPQEGVKIKIIDYENLPAETSDIIVDNLIKIIDAHRLTNKHSSYCSDNANINFAGANPQGLETVDYKLKQKFDDHIIRVGCASHIVHNAINSACYLLPDNVESIIVKIYSYF